MSRIVAAIVDTQDHADRLRAAALDTGVPTDRIEVFFLNPPGQHDRTAIGGDQDTDPHATGMPAGAGKGAAAGAAIGTAAGALAGALVPPLAPITVAGGAAVGTYAGALAGALSAGGDQQPADHGASTTGAPNAHSPGAPDVSPGPAVQGDATMRTERRTRRSGMMVAVCVDGPEAGSDDRALHMADVLRAHGAEHVEAADGRWEAGHWVDFDPTRAPQPAGAAVAR